jgi:phospholipid/cholesterol/gamma-HCH transport system ATP-binding protein
MAREQAHAEAGHSDGSSLEDVRGVPPQIEPTPGLPARAGVRRRKDRVMKILHTLPPAAQEGIIASLTDEERGRYGVHLDQGAVAGRLHDGLALHASPEWGGVR